MSTETCLRPSWLLRRPALRAPSISLLDGRILQARRAASKLQPPSHWLKLHLECACTCPSVLLCGLVGLLAMRSPSADLPSTVSSTTRRAALLAQLSSHVMTRSHLAREVSGGPVPSPPESRETGSVLRWLRQGARSSRYTRALLPIINCIHAAPMSSTVLPSWIRAMT